MTSDRDPAVQMWQESTSARLRRVEAELGSALGALAKASAEVIGLQRLLRAACAANDRLAMDHAKCVLRATQTEPTQE